MRFSGTAGYVATEDLSVAVNAAIALERPLLVKGEPGTGKTVLAEEIARMPRPRFGLVADGTPESIELFEAIVARFYDEEGKPRRMPLVARMFGAEQTDSDDWQTLREYEEALPHYIGWLARQGKIDAALDEWEEPSLEIVDAHARGTAWPAWTKACS